MLVLNSGATVTVEEMIEWVDSHHCLTEDVGHSDMKILDLTNPPPNPTPLVDYSSTFFEPPEVAQLEAAAAADNLAQFKEIYETRKDINSAKPFWKALDENHINIAAYILGQGFHPANHDFEKVMKRQAYDWMQLFLDHGFDLNISWYDYGTSPLGHALHDEKMTRWLLERGANPNTESRIMRTPLSRAVQEQPLEMIKLLMEYGGPDSINRGFLLLCAIWRKLPDNLQIVQYILDQGGDRHINEEYHTVYPDICLLPFRVPLQDAAERGLLDVVKLLLARGANPRLLDGKGLLAVDVAREKHHDEIVRYLTPFCTQSPKL
ncbi:MAG: hypothetical protein Q9219_007493 [cf. Caloplaca sp. 3 TL-2023]